MCEKSSKIRSFLKRGSGTCINDSGPGLDVDAGSSLPGPEDPHERLSGEDAGCFTHLYIKQEFVGVFFNVQIFQKCFYFMHSRQ